MARAAEQAERYVDMLEYLDDLCKAKTSDFSIEERNLLSAGYKKSIDQERQSIRFVNDIGQYEKFHKFD